MSQADLLAHAATLLAEIAGPEPGHIEMSPRGPKKYYDVKRAISEQDARAHLKGWKTKGAYLRRPNGMTRALCYDADNAQDWEHLLDAARLLAEAGYLPIVEDSPAGRGGHLWIIYTRMVSAVAAHQHLVQAAPMLQHIKECWPGPGPNKVRLPGGKYIKPSFAAWCKLHDAHGVRIAEDGQGAARVLLTYQTPADLVPASPGADSVGQTSELAALPNDVAQHVVSAPLVAEQPTHETTCCRTPIEHPSAPAPLPNVQDEKRNVQPLRNAPFPYTLPKVDAQWEARYGKVETTLLWFAIIEEYAAAWFNEHHRLEEIRPRERNHMALSPNGNERTASTSYRDTPQGERYTDHSIHGRRPDGTRDSGDALELASKVWGMSKADILRETTKEITSQARAELESAASAGQPPPLWLEEPACIITPAGRRKYAQLLVAQGSAIASAVPTPPASLSAKDSRASGPYPPPARPSYCCNSPAWRWNETEGRYACGACQDKKQ